MDKMRSMWSKCILFDHETVYNTVIKINATHTQKHLCVLMHFTNKDPGYNNILKNIRRYMGPSKYPGTYLKVYWIEFKHFAPQCITYIHTCIFRCQIYTGVLLLLYQLTEYSAAWCVCIPFAPRYVLSGWKLMHLQSLQSLVSNCSTAYSY